MHVFNSDLDLNVKNSRHRSHSGNCSTSSEASSEKPIPSPFIVDEDDNVSSLSGGLEYWLALGGKLLGVEKGNYLEKLCKINDDQVSWLPVQIKRTLSLL